MKIKGNDVLMVLCFMIKFRVEIMNLKLIIGIYWRVFKFVFLLCIYFLVMEYYGLLSFGFMFLVFDIDVL